MADIFTPEKRSEIMSRVKNKNTDIEIILRKSLFAAGFRCRTKSRLLGKPDIVLPKYKVAIFCDGDFWHGKTYKQDRKKYLPFWQDKIKTNMERDKLVSKVLKKSGWKVIRFWKSEIKKNPQQCVEKVVEIIY